jgi:hypothetical protein
MAFRQPCRSSIASLKVYGVQHLRIADASVLARDRRKYHGTCVAMDEQAAATLRRARSHQDLPDEQPEYSGRKALVMEPSRDSANHLAQKDGGLPTTLAAGAAPGGSGVSVFEHDSRAPCISPPPPGSTRYVFQLPPTLRIER